MLAVRGSGTIVAFGNQMLRLLSCVGIKDDKVLCLEAFGAGLSSEWRKCWECAEGAKRNHACRASQVKAALGLGHFPPATNGVARRRVAPCDRRRRNPCSTHYIRRDNRKITTAGRFYIFIYFTYICIHCNEFISRTQSLLTN